MHFTIIAVLVVSAQQRREEAEKRVAEWRKLSPQAQLGILDARLGKGVGAKRQREILKNRIKGADKS
jgi:hypothetical protein